jgi:hypothetical protein
MKISTKKKITHVSTYSDFLNIHAYKKFLQLLFVIKSVISIQFEITLRILARVMRKNFFGQYAGGGGVLAFFCYKFTKNVTREV